MDSIVLDATNLEIIAENIAATAQIKCCHDACGRYFHYHTIHDHEIACPHGACTCTEPGCDFTGPPTKLVDHLKSIHLISVHSFSYGKAKLLVEPIPLSGSPCRRLIGLGEDGTVFVLIIGTAAVATSVSLFWVRSVSCVWPVYMVRMWAQGQTTSSVIMDVEAEACSSPSPGTVELDDVRSFLVVPSRNLIGAESSKKLHFYVCIDKKDRP